MTRNAEGQGEPLFYWHPAFSVVILSAAKDLALRQTTTPGSVPIQSMRGMRSDTLPRTHGMNAGALRL
jgi:hypothetical protein